MQAGHCWVNSELMELMWTIGNLGSRVARRCVAEFRRLGGYFAVMAEAMRLRRKKYPLRSRGGRMVRKYYTGRHMTGIKEGVICFYDGRIYHGGLTDRIRGLLSVYEEARRRGIPFYISWTHPFRLEDYLLPAGKDWRIAPQDISYCREDSFPVIIQDLGDGVSTFYLRSALHSRLPQTHVYSNQDSGRGRYRELFKELFVPSPALKAEVDRHLAVLGKDYVVFAFRFVGLLGDFRDWKRIYLSGDRRSRFLGRVAAELKTLMAEVPAGRRILITADSDTFLEYIAPADARIYIVPGNVRHMDLEKAGADVWMKTFVDQLLIMNASKVTLMRTGEMYNSGFSRFAAEVGGVPFIYHEF